MIRGFYTALSGMISNMTRQAVVADNMSNVNTPGFKQSRTASSEFGLELSRSLGGDLGRLGTAAFAAGMTLDRSFGALETTGIQTDLAIEGDGLFAIRLTDGSVGYTRAGTFVLSGDGTLTTQLGEPVLDTAGRSIVVPGGAAAFAVGPDGTVAGTGQRIAIAAWPAGGVSRLGQNTYAFSTTPLAGSGTVRQGALERSNVDLPTAMTELITYQRSYALSSRALSLQDETIADAISVGRVR